MLFELLRRGPGATTIALLYAAVVVVAALVVTAALPAARPQVNSDDFRLLPEYKEMLDRHDKAIEDRERAVKDELVRLYDESTRTGNHELKLFSMDQQAALELRKPRWEPKKEWAKLLPGVAFPERLDRILQQYEKRYLDASATLHDDYEKLAAELVRLGRTKQAAALRADAKRRWGLMDSRQKQQSEEPPVAVPSPVKPPDPAPTPVVTTEPVVVEAEEPVLEVPSICPEPSLAMAVEVQDSPRPKPRYIDLNSFECREPDRRERLVRAFGGSDATEATVARALKWLQIHQQREDGLWSLRGPYPDGGADENHVAATAMALLAFQGAGNTTVKGASP